MVDTDGISTVGPYLRTLSDRKTPSFGFHMHLSDSEPVNWNTLVDALYDPLGEERRLNKGIRAILTGDCRKIDSFLSSTVSLGQAKSTILNVIQSLFGDYSCCI